MPSYNFNNIIVVILIDSSQQESSILARSPVSITTEYSLSTVSYVKHFAYSY